MAENRTPRETSSYMNMEAISSLEKHPIPSIW